MQISSCKLHDFDLDSFIPAAAGFGCARYGYVVTPNADHLIRLGEDPDFRRSYANADYVLLDSRFIAHVLRLARGLRLPVCPGSDLTARLFQQVVGADDPLVLIGGNETQAETLRARFGLKRLAHYDPPMGFMQQRAAVEACLDFIEAHSPFRFCFLGVGAPRQELLALRLKQRGKARGLALCIGASINFLTGAEARAPLWLRQLGLEWIYRLGQAPRRLARRYLVRGPRVFQYLLWTRFDLVYPWQSISTATATAALAQIIGDSGRIEGAGIAFEDLTTAWASTGLRLSDLATALGCMHELQTLRIVPGAGGQPFLRPIDPLACSSPPSAMQAQLLDRTRRRPRNGPSAMERRAA